MIWTNPAPNAAAVCRRSWPACERCPIFTACTAPLSGPSSSQAALDEHNANLERAALAVLANP